MENEELKKKQEAAQLKIKEDVKWLMERCPRINTLAVLEPTSQAFAIMAAISGEQTGDQSFFNEFELATLAMTGILAMHVRKLDENKFQEISPYAYVQVANQVITEDDNSPEALNNYSSLMRKLHQICLDPFKP